MVDVQDVLARASRLLMKAEANFSLIRTDRTVEFLRDVIAALASPSGRPQGIDPVAWRRKEPIEGFASGSYYWHFITWPEEVREGDGPLYTADALAAEQGRAKKARRDALAEVIEIIRAQPFYPDTHTGMRQQWVKDQIVGKVGALLEDADADD